MCRTHDRWAILIVLLAAAPASAQDDQDQAGKDERDPQLAHWQWRQELRLPVKHDGPYLALPIPPAVFGKSLDGLRDLRLTDAKGNRIPYDLRVMESKTKQTDLTARQYNAGPVPEKGSYQVSLELPKPPPPEHNEIEIHTNGSNFRRRVEVVGSDTDDFKGAQQFLNEKSYVVHYEVEGKTIELVRFHYHLKQFRHVRVSVFADATVEKDDPKITNVIVRRSIVVPGEFVTVPVNLGMLEQVRGDGGPGSAWMIDFPDKMPVEKLTFEVASPPSERPFRLQVANPNEPRTDVFRAEWRWHKDGDRQLLDISFQEVIARRLRLIVTDFANEPMQLRSVQATGCVRKLIFEKPDQSKFTAPFRLYTGNANADPANYVLGQKLPALLSPPPGKLEADALGANPAFQPPPLTLNERMPWLIYVVLGVTCAVLLLILASLAWQAIRRHDALATAESRPT